MHLQHGAIALRLCRQLLNLLLILLERLSLLKASFVLGSVLPVPQLKRTLCNSFPQVFLNTKMGELWNERRVVCVNHARAAATCGMCCERHPTQTLPTLSQPACPSSSYSQPSAQSSVRAHRVTAIFLRSSSSRDSRLDSPARAGVEAVKREVSGHVPTHRSSVDAPTDGWKHLSLCPQQDALSSTPTRARLTLLFRCSTANARSSTAPARLSSPFSPFGRASAAPSLLT